MDKRGIAAVTVFVVLLGCFFQFTRMDGFLKLDSVKHFVDIPSVEHAVDMPEMARDSYVIVYDPQDVESVFIQHRMEWLLSQMKKDSVSLTIYDDLELDKGCRGLILATGHLGRVKFLDDICRYVEDGGTAVITMHLTSDDGTEFPYDKLERMGITELGTEENVMGFRLLDDFMFGGKGFDTGVGDAAWYTSSVVKLSDSAEVSIESDDGCPLLWTQHDGDGKFILFNGSVRDDKSNIGIFASMISHCGSEGIYPVLGTKIFYIDDFPSPSPEGTCGKIYDELHMSTVDFYRNVWWPYMKDTAKTYDLKYTGLIIESYGNQVTGPFHPTAGRYARDNLIVFGRELLDMGGELGLHGYNHQPLQPVGYLGEEVEDKLEYEPWPDKEQMKLAIRELYRYVKETYPEYDFRVYVPPSDILSPEGKEAVKEEAPSVKIFSSLLDGLAKDKAYYQDFERDDDGTFEIPRISSGYCPPKSQVWTNISVVNYIGVTSHFVHPDELFYEESKHLTWQMMADGLHDFLGWINERYPWLRAVTASECADYFADYLDMDYRVKRENDKLTILTSGNRHALRFVLRTDREPDHADGAEIQNIGADAWLVETSKAEAVIWWKDDE